MEQKMLDGLAGFIFDGRSTSWNGSQKIIGLCITKPTWGSASGCNPTTFAVSEKYIETIHTICSSREYKSIFPVVCDTEPVRTSSTKHLQTSRAAEQGGKTYRPNPKGALSDEEALLGAVPFGDLCRSVPCCGRRFWVDMPHKVLEFPCATSSESSGEVDGEGDA